MTLLKDMQNVLIWNQFIILFTSNQLGFNKASILLLCNSRIQVRDANLTQIWEKVNTFSMVSMNLEYLQPSNSQGFKMRLKQGL